MKIADGLLAAFEDALTDVRDVVVRRYVARATEFAVDPGELFSPDDWTAALVNSGVPEAVAINIVETATAEFGFQQILETGFTDIDIRIVFEGPTITVNVNGLKPNFSQVIQEHVDALSTYSESINKAVQETVDMGIRNGTSVDDIAEELFDSHKFDEVSARAFAQTETIAASNGTSYAGYPDDAKKQWIYTHDDRVRPTHEEAGKQDPIPMKALFTVGNALGRYPGAPELPPGERIWCRCTLAPILSLTASGGDSIEYESETRENLEGDATRTRFNDMADKTVTLTIRKSEEAAEEVSTEASTDSESFETEGAATFAEEEAGDKKDYEWEGVLTVEGLPSGDGRMIAEGALEWRNLPVPLMLQTKTEGGHRGAEIAGSIVEIERVGQDIIGRGFFDSGEMGQEFKRLIEEGTMNGVSVDLDLVVTEFRDKSGNKLEDFDEIYDALEEGDPYAVVETVVQGRIMGATGTPFPAFQEAMIEILGDKEEAMVASASKFVLRSSIPVVSGENGWALADAAAPGSLVAGAGFPTVPPAVWFDIEEDGDSAQFPPFTVYPDGRVFGVIAEYGSCHIGFGNCVTVPEPWDGFSHACNKTTLTEDGLVPTATIYLDTVHPDLAKNASDAQTWYADTGAAVADVTLWDTPRGIVAAGAVRPDITEDQLRTFRGSDVSPDWRQMKGKLTIVGLLGVNVSGFIVERDQVLVASGAKAEVLARGRMEDGELTALVAAGIPHKVDRLEELETLYAELLHRFEVLTDTLGVELKTAEEMAVEPEASGPIVIRVPKQAAHSIRLVTPGDRTITE